MFRIAVFISGNGSNMAALHKAIQAGEVSNANLSCVISNRQDAGGMGYAAANGIPARFIDPSEYISREAFDRAVLEIMLSEKIDLICLAGFMRILSPAIIDTYYGRMMNIHPSLLPAFAGANAQQQALDCGVKVTGCTVHFVDNGMDTGPIIVQEPVPVLENDTAESLSARIQRSEHLLYPMAVHLYTSGRLNLEGRRVSITTGHKTQ